jgi:hypothetical protein
MKELHDQSSHNFTAIRLAETVGCFYCVSFIDKEKIKEWIEEVVGGEDTALCPKCGIDSLLPDVTMEQLKEMNDEYFGKSTETRWGTSIKFYLIATLYI